MRIQKYVYYLTSIFELLTGIQEPLRVLRVYLGLASHTYSQITLRQSGARFLTRGAMDIWSVKETFLDRFYERFGFKLGSGWTMLDIGGGIGEYTIFAALAHPLNRVIAFEPTPESYRILLENLRLNGLEQVEAYQEAVWSCMGELALDFSPGEPAQFISNRDASNSQSVRVACLSLQDIVNRLDLDCCHLLKIDCEGAEYEILFKTPPEVFAKIERIVMETHDGVTAYNRYDLADFLRRQGYQVEVFENNVHSHLGYLRAWRA